MACCSESLNHRDAFLLDTGAILYKWNGSECSGFARALNQMLCNDLLRSRNGKTRVSGSIDSAFWEALGGQPSLGIKSAAQVRAEEGREAARAQAADTPASRVAVLYRLQPDATSQRRQQSQLADGDDGFLHRAINGAERLPPLSLNEMARGELHADMLDADAVCLCDSGEEILVWVGADAPPREKRAAMFTATRYLAFLGRDRSTSIKLFQSSDDAFADATFAEIFIGC